MIQYLYINYTIILYIYFTPFPYLLYKNATNASNLGIAGIGLGFIQSQKIFWISNFIMIIFYIFKENINLYLNIILLSLCIFLYIISILKILNLLKYLSLYEN